MQEATYDKVADNPFPYTYSEVNLSQHIMRDPSTEHGVRKN
jgi:hypothetical protein